MELNSAYDVAEFLRSEYATLKSEETFLSDLVDWVWEHYPDRFDWVEIDETPVQIALANRFGKLHEVEFIYHAMTGEDITEDGADDGE